MSNTDQAPEPTMDEILASIRRIISDEPTDNQKASEGDKDSVADDIARALSFDSGEEPGVIGLDDDILELTEVVAKDDPVPNNGFSGNDMNAPADSVPPVPMDFQTTPPAFSRQDDIGEHPAQGLGADDFPDDVFAPSDSMDNGATTGNFGELPSGVTPETAPGDDVSGVSMSAFDDQAIFADDGLSNPTHVQEESLTDEESLSFQGSETSADLSDVEQSAMSTDTGDSATSEDTPALGEALSWDSLEEEFGQETKGGEEASAEDLEQVQGVAEAVDALAGAVDEGSSLEDDENVTFGQLSPEENLETALEQAISDIDPEAGWDEDAEDASDVSPEEHVEVAGQEIADTQNAESSVEEQMTQPSEVEQQTEVVSEIESVVEDNDEAGWDDDEEDSVSLSAEEEKAEAQVQEGMSENMALSEAAVQAEKEELADTLSAVKETVAQDISTGGQTEAVQNNANNASQEATIEPQQVSEVVPVQQQAPSPLQQQTAAAISPLEESIKDMLKPMLREWLDDNMPRLLEGAMKEQQKTDQKK